MIFLIAWLVFGLMAQLCYMLVMRDRYPDIYLKDKDDWDILPFQILMCLLAGPVSFLALAVIFKSFSDQDND